MKQFICENKKYICTGLGFLSMVMLRNWFNGPKTNIHKNMKDQVVIVTGASDGIGKETALQLLRDDAIVIFACRDEQKTNQVISSIKNEERRSRAIFMKLDLMNYDSIKSFIEEFKSKFSRLDILINNAGMIQRVFNKSPCGIESTLQVNTFAPMILTQGLIDLIHKSNGRVINVSSKLHEIINYDQKYYSEANAEEYDFNEKTFSTHVQYSFSKLGNIYFTQYLHQYALENKLNIKTAALHPGGVNTSILRDYSGLFFKMVALIVGPFYWFATKNMRMGAQTTLHLCYLADEDFGSGEYYSDCKVQAVSKIAKDKSNRDAFINFSKNLIALYGQKNEVKFEL